MTLFRLGFIINQTRLFENHNVIFFIFNGIIKTCFYYLTTRCVVCTGKIRIQHFFLKEAQITESDFVSIIYNILFIDDS